MLGARGWMFWLWARRVLILLVFAQCPLSSLFASEAIPAFDQANKLYEEGKYSDAANAYRSLVQEGKVSPALFFNLGNSLYKSGEVGRAILCYRLAEQLSPRDPDIKANLQFARDSVAAATPRANVVRRFLNLLTPNELTLLCAGGVWLLFALLTVREARPELAKPLGTYATAAALACLFFGAWLTVVLKAELGNEPSVVIAAEAVVRYGPLEESQSYFTLRNGSELTVLDHKDNWLQVRDGSGRVGWLRANQVARVSPESVFEGS
ncbi:MAG: tetratricopeptide repeat protein [Verrucomicrobia bacterium]|nr:tetratricopeptide repeat protein [Verrucomicrobiota bacterium]